MPIRNNRNWNIVAAKYIPTSELLVTPSSIWYYQITSIAPGTRTDCRRDNPYIYIWLTPNVSCNGLVSRCCCNLWLQFPKLFQRLPLRPPFVPSIYPAPPPFHLYLHTLPRPVCFPIPDSFVLPILTYIISSSSSFWSTWLLACPSVYLHLYLESIGHPAAGKHSARFNIIHLYIEPAFIPQGFLVSVLVTPLLHYILRPPAPHLQ